jgi:hypothetical protein
MATEVNCHGPCPKTVLYQPAQHAICLDPLHAVLLGGECRIPTSSQNLAFALSAVLTVSKGTVACTEPGRSEGLQAKQDWAY